MGQLGKAETPGPLWDFVKRASAMQKQTNKPRKLALQRLTDALRGKPGPQVRQAVSAANQQLSTGLQQTAEQLAQRNVGGPFASRIMAGQRLAGEQQNAMIPTQMMEAAINQMMPFLGGTQSLGMGAMGTGAGMLQHGAEFGAQQQLALLGAMGKSIGGGLSGIMGGSK